MRNLKLQRFTTINKSSKTYLSFAAHHNALILAYKIYKVYKIEKKCGLHKTRNYKFFKKNFQLPGIQKHFDKQFFKICLMTNYINETVSHS